MTTPQSMAHKKLLILSVAMLMTYAPLTAQIGSPGSSTTGLNRLGPYNGLTGAALDKGLLDEDFTIRLERQVDIAHKYLYPTFAVSKVVIKGKVAGTLRVNYHLLFGDIVFIDQKKDTLVLSDNPAIEFIQMPDHLFYHHKREGFFEMIAPQDNDVWLVARRTTKIIKTEPIAQNAALSGRGNVPADTTQYHVAYKHRDASKLLLDVTFEQMTLYFLLDKDKTVIKANRNGFLKVFGRKNDALKDYITASNPDFDQKEDLIKLYEYCLKM